MTQSNNKWMKEKLESINVCTTQYVRWLMSDVSLWHQLKFVRSWLDDNPEPQSMRWLGVWEKELVGLRKELVEMLQDMQSDEDCPFDDEFFANVDFSSIASWIEDEDIVLDYIRDNSLINRLYEVA